MCDPVLSKIVNCANVSIECSEKIRGVRLELASTPIYHNILHQMFEETRKLTLINKKLVYPKRRYLGNVEIEWLSEKNVWKVTITNGKRGKKRIVKNMLLVERIQTNPPFYVESKPDKIV